ncbi:MAG: AI-2E family transporter [Oscillibacter sp.]|jgi:predicted PurR-regulated permease PerM|nr:AI-2E family transporter [Oscillibacter sp.]
MKHENRYFKIGLTVFLVVCSILLFYDTLFGTRAIVLFSVKLGAALKPILYGAVIAYLLAPVINFFEHILFPAEIRKSRDAGRFYAPGPRAVSLAITWVIILFLVYLLLSVLLPELYQSLVQLFNSLELYYNTINDWINNLLDERPELETWVAGAFKTYYDDLVAILSQRVVPQAQQLMNAVSGGIVTALIFLKDLVVGIIVSIYLLATKERVAAHGRKLVYGLLPHKDISWVLRGVHKTDRIFAGFVRGKLLDSLIIGVLCFFFSSLFKFPYTPLVSVIIGVTNVIPFFGPFLGAIPSVFLILLVDPLKALYFVIFVFVLQQFDGNILGPLILGDKTGLSGLWVITAILVGGSFFGVPGMFFGVPVCACLYSLVAYLINRNLRKKELPVPSSAYQTDTPASPPPPDAGDAKK